MWVDAIVALFEVVAQHVSCGAKEYHEKPLWAPSSYQNHSGYEARVFWIQFFVRYFTGVIVGSIRA